VQAKQTPNQYVFGDGSVTWTCYSPGARDSGQGSGRKPARDAPRVATFAIGVCLINIRAARQVIETIGSATLGKRIAFDTWSALDGI